MPRTATVRHLLGLDGLPAVELTAHLDRIDRFRGGPPDRGVLAGRIVANLFFEDSTRTRCSFTIAAQRLGATTVDLAGAGSSLSKGESLVDTALVLEAMGVDAMVVRSSYAGTPHRIAAAVGCPVVNAGDGRHEHPTQGLLDIYTLRRRLGDLAGRCVVIVGDIAHSRVARSNVFGLTTLGADVTVVGPPELIPPAFTEIAGGPGRVSVEHDLDAALARADAVMMLRIQLERHDGAAVPPDYRRRYGLTAGRAQRLPPGAIVMHPGPMNRGVEIDAEAADDPQRSVILEQVAHGVATRMAVLTWCLEAETVTASG